MKKILLKIVFVSAVILLSLRPSAAQKIDSALNVIATQFQPEKLYIQYDREYYVAGETIWFKAYFLSDGKPSGISNNFYVQFIDSKGAVISSKKYPVFGAVAKGNIDIPDSLPQGNYYIRALTPDMLNYEEAFIYKKNIFIFHPSAGNASTAKTQQNVSLKFFPESGNLVDGILTVVGFKAVDQYGTPVEINGVIHSGDGTTIASFKSYHDGIGKVQFKAQMGKKYLADVETEAGKRTYALPDVVPAGINLKIQDEKGGKKFQLSRSENDKARFEKIVVTAEINNHLVYENEIAFEDYPSVIGHLGTDSLPSGILHFTVFDQNGAPLAERLTFVDNGEYISGGDLAFVKTDMSKRAENSIELNFPEAIQRSCSVSVVDLSGSGFGDYENIYSRLLLTSDLKGYIYNPAWYFVNRNDTTKQALDNLMLTHGWSRFNWTNILAHNFPAKTYKDQELITITGSVWDEKEKENLYNGKLSIYLEGEDSTGGQNFEVPVNAKGFFRMDSVAFMGKAKLFYAYADKPGKTKPARIHLDENVLEKNIETIPQGVTENLISKNLSALQNKDEIDNRYRYVQSKLDEVKELERVVVQAKTSKKPIDIVNEKYTTGVFKSPGKVNLDNINEPANDKSLNVVDYIKNSIQQVEIQGGRFVNRKNISLMTGQKWIVGIFLNEIPTDMIQLRVLRMDDIALIKFYEAGFVGVGSGSPGGALAVYTREKFVENKPDMLEYVEYRGYSITKEFYNPDYSVANAKRLTADNRTTLYWNPNVFTDTETKSVKMNFYNNDFSKKFKVIAEGFDANGKLIHIEKIIGN
ncbi:MAG: hypothetical protein WAT34_07895 [Chitinophagaceae bacterium]